jgi:hypothetical protein
MCTVYIVHVKSDATGMADVQTFAIDFWLQKKEYLSMIVAIQCLEFSPGLRVRTACCG